MRRLTLAVLTAALAGSPYTLAAAAVPAKADALAQVPLFFEPVSKSPAGVRFVARRSDFAAGITRQGPLLRVQNGSGQEAVVSLTFPGSPGCRALEGTDPTQGVSNYFRGRDPRGWRTGVAHFSRVSCRAAYPGVDLVYYGAGKRLEYDFRVRPGANPGRIRMHYRGADRIRIDAKGDLIIATAAGEIVQRRPVAWQQAAAGRRDVSVRYVRSGAGEIGLALGVYDRGLPLVIDPVIEYATYLGGAGNETVAGVGVDAVGNTYVAGSTMAADFPVTAGTVSSKLSGAKDVFVAKLNPTGTALLYSTFIGGSSGSEYFGDNATALAVDAEGNAFVIGATIGMGFPVTEGAWQTTGTNFALKLDPTGSRLIYSTFISPPGASFSPNAVAVRRGIAYIGGSTGSVTAYGTPGAFQRDYAGGTSDGMLLALDATGSRALFVTLLGGTGTDGIAHLAIDPRDNIVAAGYSSSPNFPAVGGVKASDQGTMGAFVAKFNPAASSLLFSAPLGATQSSGATGLALDPAGNVIVSGSTSDLARFSQFKEPAWLDPIGEHPSCCGFMVKLAADGTSVLAVALSKPAYGPIVSGSDGFLYGTTASIVDYVSGGRPASTGGGFVLAKISPEMDRLLYSAPVLSYSTMSKRLAVDSFGSVHMGTETIYANMTVTPGVVQPKFGDQPRWDSRYPVDGFVARANLSEFRSTNFFLPATQFSFNYRIGDPEPEPKTVPIAFSGEPLTITAKTDVPGLQASIVGQPASLQVRVLPTTVTPGKFNGTVTLQAWGQPALSLQIVAYLEVLDRPTFTLGADRVDMQSQEGLPETRKTVAITTDFHGQYCEFQVKSDQPWLWGYASTVSGAYGTYELIVVENAMKAGSYTGKLTVSLRGVPNSERVVTVNYTVLPAPTMTLSRREVWIRAQIGQPPPPPQVVHVTSSTPDFPLNVFTGVSYTFFKITATRDKAPADILFSADHTGLGTGIWAVATHVNLAGQPSQEIISRLAVSTSAPLDITPAEVTYSYKRGWTNAYPPTISLTGSEDLEFTVSTDQPWVTAFPATTRTPTGVYLSFSAGTLPEGKYQANLVIKVPSRNITRTVPITFNLNDVPKIVFSPAQVAFKYRIGDPAPPPQVVKVTSTTALPGGFNLAAFSFTSWLDIKPLWGSTPVDLTFSLNLDKVTAGVHSGKVSIRPTYGTTGGGDIDVTLDAAPPVAVPPVVDAIVNASSYAAGEISPGEIVAVFGTGLGPQDLANLSVENGRLTTSVAGTRVLFDGVPAPVIYSSNGQASVIVPYSLVGKTRTEVVAEYNGMKSQPALLSVAPAAPGLFTADASGKGQGAILNFIEPAGTVEYNSASLPAARGSIVLLYATGEGELKPPQADGAITGPALASPVLPVRVRIGGKEAEVLYSGTSPGLVAGLLQINVRVPADAPTGPAVSVEVQIGDYAGQPGVTMAIR